MRQFQISYQSKDSFCRELSEIKRVCEERRYSCITFYITWTGSSQTDISAVTESIEKIFPEADYYGNEASGSIAMGEFASGINVSCYVFEGKSTRTELVWVEQGTSVSSMEDLWDYCRTKDQLCAVELIPSLPYVEILKIDDCIPKLGKEIVIFGGASVNYDNTAFNADILAKGHPATRNGMAVLLYYGTDLTFSTNDILGWKGLGRLMEVTDSDGKCVRKIDQKPAYSIYEKYLNLTVDDRDTLVFPLIVEEDGNEFIRTPQTIMPDKSMHMFVNIPKGTKVRIAYGDKNTILNNIYDKAQEIADFQPDAIKAYSCAGRRLFWGNEEISKETQILENVAPVCGFYTGGEILRFGNRLRVLNQTLAIVAFRESTDFEKTEKVTIKANAPDKSLVSRLAYFTEKVSEEEELEHQQLKKNMDIIGGLATEYTMLYHIDVDNGTFTNYVAHDRVSDMREKLPNFTRYSDLRNVFLNSGFVHPDYTESLLQFFDNAQRELADKKTVSTLFKRKYGNEYLWTKAIAVKCEDILEAPHSVILGFIECDKEIRQEQEQKEKLQEALLKAQSADTAKTEFLFNMSHDIRTPMNAILGFTDIGLRYAEDPDRVKDSLKKIKASGNHLLNLINDILEMSRIESGKIILSENPLNVYQNIESIDNMSRVLAVAKSIDFETVIGEINDPFIYADELHINQVVINLISNAIKYTHDGGKVRYNVGQIGEVTNGKALYRFEVSDNGIGMSEEFQHHLFDAFSREDNSEVARIEGAGLGLSIVKRIVDLAGGSIRVKSKTGEGSVFTVDIPFRVIDDQTLEKRNKTGNPVPKIANTFTLKGKRVLLVEDNELNREIAEEILTDAGLLVETAEDGDIAVRMFSGKGNGYYDFILMDIQMPVLNGYEATKQIRQLPFGTHIPIIAVSANAFEEDKKKSIEVGMNAHIAKPIDVRALFSTMERFAE